MDSILNDFAHCNRSNEPKLGDFKIKYFCPTSHSSLSNACYAAGGTPLILSDPVTGLPKRYEDADGYRCFHYDGCCRYDPNLGDTVCISANASIPSHWGNQNGGGNSNGDKVCTTETNLNGQSYERCFSCSIGQSIDFKNGKPVGCSAISESETEKLTFSTLSNGSTPYVQYINNACSRK